MSYLNDNRFQTTTKATNYMTPDKSMMSIDTTISHAKPQKNFSFSTPRSKSSITDENSLLTPIIKKSKRRDCTPIENQTSQMITEDYNPISRSRFLETLESTNEQTEDNNLVSRIKGSYLLNCLENNNMTIYQVILSDAEIFNEVINTICGSLFEGFNKRSNVFFKFLVYIINISLVQQYWRLLISLWLALMII
jgi:hypothetical protein